MAIPDNTRDATLAYKQAFVAVNEIGRLLQRGDPADPAHPGVQIALQRLADTMIQAAQAYTLDEYRTLSAPGR